MTRTITTPEELEALPPSSVVEATTATWAHVVIRSGAPMGGAGSDRYSIAGTKEWLAMAGWGATLTVLHDTSATAPAPDDREALIGVIEENAVERASSEYGSVLLISDAEDLADAVQALGFRRLTITPELTEAGGGSA